MNPVTQPCRKVTVMTAIDEHYYQQIKRYYVYDSSNSFVDDHPAQEHLDDPLF